MVRKTWRQTISHSSNSDRHTEQNAWSGSLIPETRSLCCKPDLVWNRELSNQIHDVLEMLLELQGKLYYAAFSEGNAVLQVPELRTLG